MKFSDGTALDAAAVKANLDYGAAHPAGAECNAYLSGLKTHGPEPHFHPASHAQASSWADAGPGQCAGFIVSPKALANPKSLTSTPDGSGPYTLQSSGTIAGQQYTFVKNPSYWNASAFPFKTIVLTMFTSTTAAVNAVRGGQSDVASNLDGVATRRGRFERGPARLAHRT